MATKNKNLPIEEPLQLLVDKAEAESNIKPRIDKGNGFLERQISNDAGVDELVNDYKKWNDFNEELIRNLFTGGRLLQDYDRHKFVSFSMYGGKAETLKVYKEMIKKAVQELESIIERLVLIPGKHGPSVPKQQNDIAISRDIFIVHGHDDGLMEKVARLIERLSLNPIILHEQANKGLNLIEKFEKHSHVRFAVVLLTPDDMGRVMGGAGRPRARQNVILELGYFFGKLGRDKVCALYKEDVELPSDLSGIIYVKFDAGDAWKLSLAKEIIASGIDIDLNKI